MTFGESSRDALKAHVRTVVVIDDVVSSDAATPAPNPLQTPGRGNIAGQESLPDSPSPFSGMPLDGAGIIQAFFREGILCTVLQSNDVPTDKPCLMNADILILDWMLNDCGEKTSAFIKTLSENHPDALHMVCIYTSEPDREKIWNKLKSIIPELNPHNKDNHIYTCRGVYILVVNKTSLQNNSEENFTDKGHKASPEELPNVILSAFAPCVCGLLRNALFYAIKAIRDNTHVLLERFSPDLDPAFVTHRVLSVPCEDTEQHIIPLICSEIESILAQHQISHNLNADAIKCWLEDPSVARRNAEIVDKLADALNKNTDTIIKKGIFEVLTTGQVDKLLKDSKLTSYWGSNNASIADVQLSVLMSCEYNYTVNHPPVLKTGTILKSVQNEDSDSSGKIEDRGNIYLLCLQPPCDCVRIENEGRPFIFIPLQNSTPDKKVNFSYVQDNEIMHLKKDTKTFKIFTIIFKPNTGSENISAYKKSKVWIFCDVTGNTYEFILQLKEVHALRHVQEYSAQLARIGLTESDWQRRLAR